jgi:hypothetical protein
VLANSSTTQCFGARHIILYSILCPPLCDGGNITSAEGYLVGLWRHECERVFVDKLTNNDDKNWTDDLIQSIIKQTFGSDIHKQVEERVYWVGWCRLNQ